VLVVRPGPTSFLLLLPFLVAACGGPDRDERPSILLVTVDTLRADALGCYGNSDARTPRMDRLAAEGLRFTQVGCSCPLTLPSHATILTGLDPAEHGLRDNDPPAPLPPPTHRSFTTLAEDLAAAGYATAAFVSASVVAARTGLAHGFEVYDGPEEGAPGELRYRERIGGETAELAAAWLADAKRPFFLWVHLFDPHDPYRPPVAFRSGAPPGSPEAYADEVAYADRCVGMLLDALEEAGDASSAVTLVTSDHGEGLGEHGEPTHGYLLYETTLRVPLILRWPGKVEEATATRVPTSLARIRATLLAAAGLPTPEGSVSLLEEEPGATFVAESLYGWRLMGWAQLYSARRGDRKLIRGAETELYDLPADPGEISPIDEPAADLRAALDRYRILAPRTENAGQVSEEIRGLPYASGIGRSRLVPIPWEENEKRRSPDPLFAAELDRLKARVGREDPGAVRTALLDLAKRDPGNPSIHFWLGRASMNAGDPMEAAGHFERAFEAGLSEAKVLDLWLRQLLLAERYDLAEEVIRERVPDVVPDAGTYIMLGSFHLATGDRAEAGRFADLAERIARTGFEKEQVSRFRHNLGSENDK
jgi:arylsulfatase A-like enzyme